MNFADLVATLCNEKFTQLGKVAKPNYSEFILLACFIEEDSLATKDGMRVVALGTGSKCIGGSQLPCDGSALHDSHAETIARRAFKLYLLHEIEKCMENKASIFINQRGCKFKLRNGLSYHFYTSQTPCGDASIISKEVVDASSHIEPSSKRRRLDYTDNVSSSVGEACTIINDTHRTGAKVVAGEQTDPRSNENYHTIGVLRTKPGRGDRTLSHCCSDKMFKWTVLGIQGALIMLFVQHPIYLSSIVVGKGPFREDAFYRAMHGRFSDDLKSVSFPANYCLCLPDIMRANIDLTANCHKAENSQPSSMSIIWSYTSTHRVKHECSVFGRRLGVTKKDRNSGKGNVSVCRKEMAKFIVRLLKKQNNHAGETLDFINTSYSDLKKSSLVYHSFWCLLKSKVLINWTLKPDFVKSFKI